MFINFPLCKGYWSFNLTNLINLTMVAKVQKCLFWKKLSCKLPTISIINFFQGVSCKKKKIDVTRSSTKKT
jgi:hypothetical protein